MSCLFFLNRCPNPKACKHNPAELADLHPYNFNLPKSKNFRMDGMGNTSAVTRTWPAYLEQQCAVSEGYTGLYCGVCVKSYGMTSAFNCKKCLTKPKVGSPSTYRGAEQVNGAGTVGMYLMYWVLLTAWYVFSVWSSLEAKTSTTKRSSSKDANSHLYGNDTRQSALPVVPIEATGDTPCALGAPSPVKNGSEAGMLDIAKVRLCFTQAQRFSRGSWVTQVVGRLAVDVLCTAAI